MEQDDPWYICEMNIIRELRDKLKLNAHIVKELVDDLNDMYAADCSVIELVLLQAKRDKNMRAYLDQYNALKQGNPCE